MTIPARGNPGGTLRGDTLTEQTLWEPPEVEIAGETYEMRRLGIKDLKSLWGIIQTAMGQGLEKEKIKEMQEDNANVEDVGVDVLLEIVPIMTDKLSEWLVSTLENGDEIDVEDPNEFPVFAPLDIINTLGEDHEDFKKFFTKAGQASKILQKMGKSLSLTSSTQSQADTDGQTSE